MGKIVGAIKRTAVRTGYRLQRIGRKFGLRLMPGLPKLVLINGDGYGDFEDSLPTLVWRKDRLRVYVAKCGIKFLVGEIRGKPSGTALELETMADVRRRLGDWDDEHSYLLHYEHVVGPISPPPMDRTEVRSAPIDRPRLSGFRWHHYVEQQTPEDVRPMWGGPYALTVGDTLNVRHDGKSVVIRARETVKLNTWRDALHYLGDWDDDVTNLLRE